MKDVAVVGYCRTGIAKAGRGALNQTHGVPMAAHVLRQVVERAGIDPGEVEDVVLGCGLPEGCDRPQHRGQRCARGRFRRGGAGRNDKPVLRLRPHRAASVVANRIATGEATVAIAGGVESISLVQFNLNMNGFIDEPLQQGPLIFGRLK